MPHKDDGKNLCNVLMRMGTSIAVTLHRSSGLEKTYVSMNSRIPFKTNLETRITFIESI